MAYKDYKKNKAKCLEDWFDDEIEEFLVSRFYPELKYIHDGKTFEKRKKKINHSKKVINKNTLPSGVNK